MDSRKMRNEARPEKRPAQELLPGKFGQKSPAGMAIPDPRRTETNDGKMKERKMEGGRGRNHSSVGRRSNSSLARRAGVEASLARWVPRLRFGLVSVPRLRVGLASLGACHWLGPLWPASCRLGQPEFSRCFTPRRACTERLLRCFSSVMTASQWKRIHSFVVNMAQKKPRESSFWATLAKRPQSRLKTGPPAPQKMNAGKMVVGGNERFSSKFGQNHPSGRE